MPTTNKVFCPRCGAPLSPNDTICPMCGMKISRPQQPVGTLQQPVNPPTTPQMSQQPPQQPPQLLTCPNCGHSLDDPTLKYCPICGFNLEAARRQLMPAMAKRSFEYYGRKQKFFSFEGYNIEGVPFLAGLLILLGVWNFFACIMSLTGGLAIWIPGFPAGPYGVGSEPTSVAIFYLVMASLLIFSALGLLMVKTPAFYASLLVAIILVPLSIFQIIYATTGSFPSTPSGTHQMDNILMGLVGIFTSFGIILQSLRTQRYFLGAGRP